VLENYIDSLHQILRTWVESLIPGPDSIAGRNLASLEKVVILSAQKRASKMPALLNHTVLWL